jgi:hypothetical protein
MAHHSQHTSESRHSDEDITVEIARVSTDDNSILKEKYDLEVQSLVKEVFCHDDHPDGGLTAWLIVCGVRLPLFCRNLTID